MENLLENSKSIVSFLILETVLLNLISNQGFQKMLRLCSGVILILLVLKSFNWLVDFTGTADSFLKKTQLDQTIRQCEDMIAEGDVYLTEQYTQQYKETVESGIRELAEQEGIVLNRCQIVLSEGDEIKLSRIELEIDTDDGTVQESEVEKVHISLTETEEQTETESPDIIKLKNNIIDIYGIGEENIIIIKG